MCSISMENIYEVHDIVFAERRLKVRELAEATNI